MICDKFEKCCENIAGKPLLKKRVFPHPFPKTFGIYAVFNGFLEIGAEGTGRAPTIKRVPK